MLQNISKKCLQIFQKNVNKYFKKRVYMKKKTIVMAFLPIQCK